MVHHNKEQLISLSAVVLTHYNNDLDEGLSLITTYIFVRWSLLNFVSVGRLGIGLNCNIHRQTAVRILPYSL